MNQLQLQPQLHLPQRNSKWLIDLLVNSAQTQEFCRDRCPTSVNDELVRVCSFKLPAVPSSIMSEILDRTVFAWADSEMADWLSTRISRIKFNKFYNINGDVTYAIYVTLPAKDATFFRLKWGLDVDLNH